MLWRRDRLGEILPTLRPGRRDFRGQPAKSQHQAAAQAHQSREVAPKLGPSRGGPASSFKINGRI